MHKESNSSNFLQIISISDRDILREESFSRLKKSYMLKDVIVIIPLYRNYLEEYERISLDINLRFLKRFDIFFVSPKKLQSDEKFREILLDHSIEAVYFNDKYFHGHSGYNKLLMNIVFYKRFVSYDYMLICQLDALIISDKLNFWLSQGYDYIGGPWINKKQKTFYPDSVGNGGLSLRKVSKFNEVLDSNSLYFNNNKYYSVSTRVGLKNLLLFHLVKRIEKSDLKFVTKKFLYLFQGNEDYFWSFFAQFFVKEFYLPSPQKALQFSFEESPLQCYLMNNKLLPFGCHAWEKYDLEFWKEYSPELKEELQKRGLC